MVVFKLDWNALIWAIEEKFCVVKRVTEILSVQIPAKKKCKCLQNDEINICN